MHTSNESYNLKFVHHLNFHHFRGIEWQKDKRRDSMIHKEMKYQTFNDRKNYAAKRFYCE